jgi:uncharacterized Fe-S cluster protein YjdI
MKIFNALFFCSAISGEEPMFAGETLPWMQPEASQDYALKKCFAGRTCRVGGMTLLAANL